MCTVAAEKIHFISGTGLVTKSNVRHGFVKLCAIGLDRSPDAVDVVGVQVLDVVLISQVFAPGGGTEANV